MRHPGTGLAHLRLTRGVIPKVPVDVLLHGLIAVEPPGAFAHRYAPAGEAPHGAAESLVLSRMTRGCQASTSLGAARSAWPVIENKYAAVAELEVASNWVLPEIAIEIDPLTGPGDSSGDSWNDSRNVPAEAAGALPAEAPTAVDRGIDPGCDDPGSDVVPEQAKTGPPPA